MHTLKVVKNADCFTKYNLESLLTLVNVYVALPVFTPVAGSSSPILWNKMAAPSMLTVNLV